jgi:hypothetical protein
MCSPILRFRGRPSSKMAEFPLCRSLNSFRSTSSASGVPTVEVPCEEFGSYCWGMTRRGGVLGDWALDCGRRDISCPDLESRPPFARLTINTSAKKKSCEKGGECKYRLDGLPLDSKAYHAAPAATRVAPTFAPADKGFPKTATLNAKLVNFLILRIIAIVRAVEMAERRFTPRTQRYWVTTLRRRKKMWRGRTSGKGRKSAMGMRTWIGGEEERVWKSLIIRGRRGMKNGRPRKCCRTSETEISHVFGL